MARNRLPFISHRPLTGFDYVALTGFSINMAVVAFIVVNWLSS